jgi:hypothetical protein
MLYELRAGRLEPLQAVGAVRRPAMFAHLGSSITLVLGFFGLIGALSAAFKGEDTSGMLVGGPIMILGALAYRSAKKRQRDEVASTFLRWMFEGTAILLIVLLLTSQNDLKYLMTTYPAPYFIMPVWAIAAYLVAAVKAMMRRER